MQAVQIFSPSVFINAKPPDPPTLAPNPRTAELQAQTDLAVAREVGRRLQHLGQPPSIKPASPRNYGHSAPIARPSLHIPASSSWNPTPTYEVMGAVADASALVEPGDPGEADEPEDSTQVHTPVDVQDCLLQVYHFDRDFQMRTEPTFPRKAVSVARDLNARRKINNRRNSRFRRARPPGSEQRAAKWQSLVRRDNKAAAVGIAQVAFWLVNTFVLSFTLALWGVWSCVALLAEGVLRCLYWVFEFPFLRRGVRKSDCAFSATKLRNPSHDPHE